MKMFRFIFFAASAMFVLQSTHLSAQPAANNSNRLGAALENATAACNNKVVEACYDLGELYESGELVKKNEIRALQFYALACDGNHAKGCMTAAIMYCAGLGKKGDIKSTNHYVGRAWDLNPKSPIARSLMVTKCTPGYK